MGVLEELRQQTNLKKVHDDVQKTREQIWQQNYINIVLPKMQQIYYYFKEVIDHLQFVDHKIDIKDYSERYPKFETLTQQNYRISTDGRGGIGSVDKLKEIDISFYLIGEGEFSYIIKHKPKIEIEAEFLRSCRVPYHWLTHTRGEDTDVGTFKVKRKVPVLFKIAVDYENAKIVITANNHEDLSSFKKTYNPDHINEEFLNDLARYILREDREFILLEISNEQKQFIKKQAEKHYGIKESIKDLIGLK